MRNGHTDGRMAGRTASWTDGWRDGRTDGRKDGRTDKPSYRDAFLTDTSKNNKNVFKFDEIPFKRVCDKQTDGPADQLTSQKVAYSGLGMAYKHSKTFKMALFCLKRL